MNQIRLQIVTTKMVTSLSMSNNNKINKNKNMKKVIILIFGMQYLWDPSAIKDYKSRE